MHLSSGQETSVFFVQLLTQLVLWASWKEPQVLLVQKNVQRMFLCLLKKLTQTHTCPTDKIACLGHVFRTRFSEFNLNSTKML